MVERGSFITSELKLMERWGWGRKKVKLFLNFLESQKMIERNANNKRTAITIVNYGFYQDCDLPKEQQKNSKRTAKEKEK
jgi:DNA replication protein DnaD